MGKYMSEDVMKRVIMNIDNLGLGGKKATVTVNVKETVYDVLLKVEEITINQLQVKDYDFLSLFTTTIDGVSVPITEDMIENNVKDVTGTYTFIVTFKILFVC